MSNSQNASSASRNRPQQNDDEIDLGRLFNVLLLNKTWIGLSLVAGLVAGALYALSTTPVYQSNALLQIEPKNKNQILGELSALTGNDSGDTATEIQIIRSRMVLGNTVDELNLTARPEYVRPPFFTKYFGDKRKVAPELVITSMVVPDSLHGETFTLTYQGGNKFEITTPDDATHAATTGTAFTTPEGVSLHVSKFAGLPGDQFEVTPISRQSAITRLSRALGVQENGKKTNIMGMSLDDENPARAQDTLNTIIDHYVNQNKEYDSQVAGASLEFIHQQLPEIKQKLEEAENQLNAFRNRNATVDIAIESQGVVQSLNQIDMQLTDLKIKESEVSQLYTPDHPVYKAIAEKKQVLENARKQLLGKIGNLPKTQQEVIRLSRDVEIQQAIYQQLLTKQQELSINQASKLGNIRVIDRAQTLETPIKPKKALIVLAATLGAGLLSALFFILRSLFRRGIEEAHELEDIGVPVLSSVPLSVTQRKHDLILKHLKRRDKNVRSNFLLAANQPDDIAVEALRSLRTALYFNLMEARNNVLMITGATLAVGKSFVSANLATVMAQGGKKVLLIDADLRKGYSHELLNVELGQGLAEYLANPGSSAQIKTTSVPGLDFMSHGSSNKVNPAELLSSPRLAELLQQASAQYDIVIVDSPPVLAVTDASIIGQLAGTTLMVTRFEQTTVKDIEASLDRLRNNQITVSGAVLNGIERSASNYHAYEAYSAYGKKD